MPNFTFLDIVIIGLLLAFVQVATHFLFEFIRKRFERRKNQTIFDLYINDKFIGKHSLEECRGIYDRTSFKGSKGCGYSKKTKAFHIDVDM